MNISRYVVQIITKMKIRLKVLGLIIPRKAKKNPKKVIMMPKRLSKCSYDHNNFSSLYTEEGNQIYCKEGNELCNIKCSECKKLFL